MLGTEAAFVTSLLHLQTTRGIDRKEAGMATFDVLGDELDPDLYPPSSGRADRDDPDDKAAVLYVRAAFYFIRRMAASARRSRMTTPDRFEEGVEVGGIQVLRFMQQQADAFGIDRELVGMADFDPLVNELEPTARDLSRL